jgi:hypothetical protein
MSICLVRAGRRYSNLVIALKEKHRMAAEFRHYVQRRYRFGKPLCKGTELFPLPFGSGREPEEGDAEADRSGGFQRER